MIQKIYACDVTDKNLPNAICSTYLPKLYRNRRGSVENVDESNLGQF